MLHIQIDKEMISAPKRPADIPLIDDVITPATRTDRSEHESLGALQPHSATVQAPKRSLSTKRSVQVARTAELADSCKRFLLLPRAIEEGAKDQPNCPDETQLRVNALLWTLCCPRSPAGPPCHGARLSAPAQPGRPPPQPPRVGWDTRCCGRRPR